MSIKRLVLIIMFITVFLFELIIGGTKKSGMAFLLLIILLISYEIYGRIKNNTESGSKFDEEILVRKDRDYYLSVVNITIMLLIINIREITAITSPKESYLYENEITLRIIISMGLLLIFYGYFYIVSKQILYKDGLKLTDNKFISKDDIEEITYRRTLIMNSRLIEINTKKSARSFRKKIEIKCESENEFLKVIEVLEGITGVEPRNLEC